MVFFMSDSEKHTLLLPAAEQIREAIRIYLAHAYGGSPPEAAAELLPGEGEFDPAEWLAGEMVAREPNDEDVRNYAFRLGNALYPHMKFCLTRTPDESMCLFRVDSHDAILHAPAGSPDAVMLEELKAHNAEVAGKIQADWDAAGLPTERSYMRWKIEQAKKEKAKGEKAKN
jgi:hypothetical protein